MEWKYARYDETNAKDAKANGEAQEELGEKRIEGAGGGMVKVIVTGHKEVVEVNIKRRSS